ncbi:MAG: hypothetical protein K6C68_02275 [Ruminococcus sp.]|nr:hypothetical protein [Ruminococcus sp.]
MKNKTLLTVLIPLFAVNAYAAGAFLAKNKELRRLFTVMSGLMTGLMISELIGYLTNNFSEEHRK